MQSEIKSGFYVIPAQAGIQSSLPVLVPETWTPACSGVTNLLASACHILSLGFFRCACAPIAGWCASAPYTNYNSPRLAAGIGAGYAVQLYFASKRLLFSALIGVNRRPNIFLRIFQMSSTSIKGRVHLLGDNINTDLNCSSKYLPGKDNAYIAKCVFEQVAPGFAARFRPGDVIVAGKNFGINSSREQTVHILRMMGVAAIVGQSFGRQFFRNTINNGLPAIECDIAGIADGDEIEIDLAAGKLTVGARGIGRTVAALPPAVQQILATGGLIAYLREHPDWQPA